MTWLSLKFIGIGLYLPTYAWRHYLLEGFWNGFLLGQTCEIPATARGNHFRTVVCLDSLDSLDSLDMFICCTGIRLLVEEQKMAEIVLGDLIITEIHWHWVVPAYLRVRHYLWEGLWNGFLLGQTCEIPAAARGNHFRTVVCLGRLR